MKRFFSFFLIVCVLLSGIAGAEEQSHYRLQLRTVSAGMEKEIEMDFYIHENTVSVFSSLFPDTCIRLTADGYFDSGFSFSPAVDFHNTSEQFSRIISESVQEWISFMNPEIRTGIFTGDVFDTAGVMEYIRFSYSDLVVLMNMINRRIKDLGIPDIFSVFLSGSEVFLPRTNYQFELKMFDQGKYYSLNVLDGTDVLLTLSLNAEKNGNIIMVLGYGEEKKNYYHQLNMDFSQINNMKVSGKIYADDQRVGFSGINDRQLICSSVIALEQEAESGIRLSVQLIPANDVPPAVFTGNIDQAPSAEHVFDGKLHFSEEERFKMIITMDRDSDSAIPQAGKTLEMNTMSADESNALSSEIGKNLAPFIIQMMTSLPEAYVHLIIGE